MDHDHTNSEDNLHNILDAFRKLTRIDRLLRPFEFERRHERRHLRDCYMMDFFIFVWPVGKESLARHVSVGRPEIRPAKSDPHSVKRNTWLWFVVALSIDLIFVYFFFFNNDNLKSKVIGKKDFESSLRSKSISRNTSKRQEKTNFNIKWKIALF